MSKQAAKPAGCANCRKMEQRYQKNPRSFWIRLWKWHSGWCPRHQAYRRAEEARSANQAVK